MSWEDAAQVESRLKHALDAFDWQGAQGICNEIIGRIKNSEDKIPETTARRLLANLRRKRRFPIMRSLAETIIQSGVIAPQVRRQYAQALIDDADSDKAEDVLNAIVQDPGTNAGEISEARGLLGRVYKQRYVNDANTQANPANLQRALELYYETYRVNPQMNLWHGINTVALTARARRDGLAFAVMPNEIALAQELLATISTMEANSNTGVLAAYDEATRMEAYVALGEFGKADESALRYIDSCDADAFEIKSTIRQLEEVWQLSYEKPPGNHLLPLLKATQLSKEGGFANRDSKNVGNEAKAVGLAENELEALFGKARTVTLKWYKLGLEQCNSVARIETPEGRGMGTGWLVKASDFYPDREGVLLLTNYHVIPTVVRPEDAQANFQVMNETFQVKEIVWSSPVAELDATLVTLDGVPKAAPLVLHDPAVEMTDPAPRLYIIGHPMGRDIEFSIQDNHLLACNERLLHYRTPTEPGSSGSPVFESQRWRVVALHHGGSATVARIDGKPGTYEANEGIAIPAIKKKIQAG